MPEITFCDAHNHISQCKDTSFINANYLCCASFQNKEDYDNFSHTDGIIKCYGIHPWYASENVTCVEEKIISGNLKCIGEIGIDLCNDILKSTALVQESCFEKQLDLAVKYQLPVVLHVIKGFEIIFKFSEKLSKIPSVIFHSFNGNLFEAKSLLKKGINCFFSFGKPILAERKNAVDCVINLPIERILFETDAPFQKLRGEMETRPEDIVKVYQKASELRKVNICVLSESVQKNFKRAFLFQ